MVKQYEVLKWASSFLQKYNRETEVANILLQDHLQVSREQFYLTMRDPIDEKIVNRFKQSIKQHAMTGIPYQHLIGYEYFYGRKFLVNKHVLIPRPETEELVHLIINNHKKAQKPLTIVDVGTGSGIIAITLALELPDARIYATDISEKALIMAKKNAEKHGANVQFLSSNYLTAIIEQKIDPHIIVSNPPYIKLSAKKLLTDTVKQYDPHIALFAENDGLQAYEDILSQSKLRSAQLNDIYFEIGYDQEEAVQQLIKSYYPMATVDIIKDMNQNNRIVHSKI